MKAIYNSLVRHWAISLIVAMVLFILARPVFADLLEREVQLGTFLSSENVPVGVSHNSDGNPQIYYAFDGQRTVITTETIPHADPVTDGKYIAWMSLLGQYWQVFLYHIPTGTTVQLTQGNANSVNPKIADGRVLWEGQVDGAWQVFLYDGGQVKQLTEGEEPSINSDLEGEFVVYSTKIDFGEWKSFAYDAGADEYITLTPTSFSKRPILTNGHVYWDDFDGINRTVFDYDLARRDKQRLSSGRFPAFGVRIVGNKVVWFEDIPVVEEEPITNDERASQQEVSGEQTSSVPELKEQPQTEEQQITESEPVAQETELPTSEEEQPAGEEEVEEPELVSEEEVAEELGSAPEAEETAVTEEEPETSSQTEEETTEPEEEQPAEPELLEPEPVPETTEQPQTETEPEEESEPGPET